MSNAIESNIRLIDQHLEFIRTNLDRTERNLVLYNLLGKVRLYLYCLASSLSAPTEQIGFLTRSLFELNLITRYVLMGEENLKRFVSETALDRIQILEGLLELRQDSSKEAEKILEEEIARVKALVKKHCLTLQKPAHINTIAKMVGIEYEYKALYKLFSKYVHPSSYIINASPEEINSNEVRNIFLIQAQIYAGDTFQRIKQITTSGVA